MPAHTASFNKIGDIKYYAYAIQDSITVSTGDTITCEDFVDEASSIKKAVLMQNSDGSEVDCTTLNNVVTVGGAVTSVECTLFVFGRRA